ncbi:hypothetical protein O3G_MSEX010285 [Manduca sexta]|uniref:Uncharacterized protein n=1 Tax=Manduca sexta TaxID=7130 RepID=A0A921ZGK8_MANSE|nr:hypothetical protein O3G_MSEX010285 [Manduca sexta]
MRLAWGKPKPYLDLCHDRMYCIFASVFRLFQCNNVLLVAYILLELLRLIVISIIVATGLLLLKQNTMDIGILIGASVAGGFLLLGMFYLWICAANLPVLINEMERDDQSDTITKLREILEAKNQRNDLLGFHSTPRKSKILLKPTNGIPHNMKSNHVSAQIYVG